MQPFNYQLQVQDPFKSVLGAVQLGEGIRSMEATRQQAALAQQREQQAFQAVEKLHSPDATIEDYRRAALLGDKNQADNVRQLWTQRSEAENRDDLNFTGQVFSAFRSGKPDIAREILDKKIAGLENSGKTESANALKVWRNVSVEDAQSAEDFFGTTLPSIPGGEKVLEGALKLREAGKPEEGYRMLTPKQVAEKGLPPGSYQEGPKGEIKTVVKEPLVKITGPLVGAENKYGEVVGKETAEEDVGAVKSAIKGAGDLTKINRTLNELYSSKAITGLGADTFKNIERVKTLLGSDFAARKVADTELLDALLGADVFPQIGALNIGAKGLDTPSEREFLRQVMTGTTSMNRNTLIRMTEIRRDVQEESIKQYNERLERGELDRYFEITKRQKKPISLTKEQEQRIQRRREGIDTSQERRAAKPGAPTRSPTAAPATPGMKSTDDILRELEVLR